MVARSCLSTPPWRQSSISSVSEVTDYKLDNQSLIPSMCRDFSPHHCIQNNSSAQPGSYLFLRVKWPEHKADHSPTSSLRAKNAWSFTSILLLHGIIAQKTYHLNLHGKMLKHKHWEGDRILATHSDLTHSDSARLLCRLYISAHKASFLESYWNTDNFVRFHLLHDTYTVLYQESHFYHLQCKLNKQMLNIELEIWKKESYFSSFWPQV